MWLMYLYDGISSEGSQKTENIFFADTLLLYNMTASSGLREMFTHIELFPNVDIYSIIND